MAGYSDGTVFRFQDLSFLKVTVRHRQMKVRFNRVPLYLTLALVPFAVIGCGESKEDLSVKPSPQPVASAPFPSPSVPATLNSPSKIALTRPTNPDDRLRVIKSGRTDPFGSVGPTASVGGNSASSGSSSPGGSRSTTQEQVGNRIASSYEKFLKGITGSLGGSKEPNSPLSGGQIDPAAGVTLPELPKAPEPANVKVTGVVVMGGQPRAIVQAPDEPTSRTVGIGDSLSGGRLFVKNIDTSNRAEPTVVFQQGSIEFSVAVGREPVLIASASPLVPNPPVRGLYSIQRR
jgi:hypothetical protein